MQQLVLPLFIKKNNTYVSIYEDNSTKNIKKESRMKEKTPTCIIVDELLDEEIEKKKQSEIDKQAWQWTMDVDKWIWKQIRDRRVPEQDWQDVYNLCVIEVFNLMKNQLMAKKIEVDPFT